MSETIKTEDIKKMNLYEKMMYIENEIGIVNKNLTVGTGGSAYTAVSEADVKKAVSPLEFKYRVKSVPTGIEIVENDILKVERKDWKSGGVKEVNEFYLRVRSTVVFINVDNPEERISVHAYGDGMDTGDKAPGKGDTYSVKYCYLKAYKIATGDDPDKEPSNESSDVKPKAQAQNNYNKGFKKADTKATTKGNSTAKPSTNKPATTKTDVKEIVPATKAQQIRLEKLIEEQKLDKRLKVDKVDKTTASMLISKAKDAKSEEVWSIKDGQVVALNKGDFKKEEPKEEVEKVISEDDLPF